MSARNYYRPTSTGEMLVELDLNAAESGERGESAMDGGKRGRNDHRAFLELLEGKKEGSSPCTTIASPLERLPAMKKEAHTQKSCSREKYGREEKKERPGVVAT